MSIKESSNLNITLDQNALDLYSEHGIIIYITTLRDVGYSLITNDPSANDPSGGIYYRGGD